MSSDRGILVIDDEKNFCQLLGDFLRGSGYDVRTACELETALETYRKQRPKVVILDFNMPLVNGDKFMPILQDLNPMVRIIVLTGCVLEEVEDKFRGLGYFAFFEKAGLSLAKLKEKIDEALAY
ncbi:MAG: Regulator of RpoS [Candidatus Omnitrophica bacterium]|nr:Regulator of RpoS [Candidatus Omnitrophota bacterium]